MTYTRTPKHRAERSHNDAMLDAQRFKLRGDREPTPTGRSKHRAPQALSFRQELREQDARTTYALEGDAA